MPDDEVLIELDSRGRATLGRLSGDNKRFLASADENGTITLQPAVVRSLIEDRLLRDPSIVDAVKSARDPAHRVRNRQSRRPAEQS